MCISRATVSAVSCLVVPAFICIDLPISLVLKINDDDDDDDDEYLGLNYICNVILLSNILCSLVGTQYRIQKLTNHL